MYLNSFPLNEGMENGRKGMGKMRVAVVMPNHADLNSSLNNYVKTLQYIAEKKWADITLFTDEKNALSLSGITVKKIRGFDYKTPLEKLLLLLGIPRDYYFGLEEHLKGYDVIVANNPEFYAYACQSYKIAKKHGKKFVLRTSQTVDGFFLYKVTKYLINPTMKKAYGYASCCIFANPEAKQRCIRLGLLKKGSRAIITGHATDTECFRPMKVKKPKNKVILSVGGLLKLKGHQYIIEALRMLQSEGHKDTELWIVGKGPYEGTLRSLVQRLGVEESVKFLGAKSHEDLAKIYNKASVFALANEQEITPAVNEALACGVPVVVVECGGYGFVVHGGKEGLIACKNDPEDLAAKMKMLLEEESYAKQMAGNGKKRVKRMFSIPVVARKVAIAFAK